MRLFIFYILILFSLSVGAHAQQPVENSQSNPSVEMADSLRSEGKIYVVVLVVAILFTFFLGYLVVADRQLKKVEKEVENLKSTEKKE